MRFLDSSDFFSNPTLLGVQDRIRVDGLQSLGTVVSIGSPPTNVKSSKKLPVKLKQYVAVGNNAEAQHAKLAEKAKQDQQNYRYFRFNDTSGLQRKFDE